MDLLWFGGEGPKDIPSWAYAYLTIEKNVLPESLLKLRAMLRTGYLDNRPVEFIRIYDPTASEDSWKLKDFSSLDSYPQIVRYEGYREKEGDKITIEPFKM